MNPVNAYAMHAARELGAGHAAACAKRATRSAPLASACGRPGGGGEAARDGSESAQQLAEAGGAASLQRLQRMRGARGAQHAWGGGQHVRV